MSYRILGQSLWPIADATKRYFKEQLGLTNIKIEEEVSPGVSRPTLHARTRDQNIICAEFMEDSCYGPNVDRFVSSCKNRQIPVKLYVVFPEGARSVSFSHDLRTARDRGVGVISVTDTGEVTVLAEPISLTLSDLRKVNAKEFPSKYKSDITTAQQTYLLVNPVKGCGALYDIIEALTRRVAAKLHGAGWVNAWVHGAPNFERDSWLIIADAIYKTLDYSKVPNQNRPLWAKVISVTTLRNDSGHEPKSMGARIARDKELRTRFEDAADLLRKLIDATKDLRV